MQNSVLHIFLKLELFEVKSQWDTIMSDWIRLYASTSQKTKTIHKISSRNSTITISIKPVCD